MITIICIVGVVLFFSLYDYFASRKWEQVTSVHRNDVVFEKRNKAYGAYVIRRDYNKQMAIILLCLTTGLGVAYGAFRATRGKIRFESEEKDVFSGTLIPVDLKQKEEIIEEPKEEEVEEQKVEQTRASLRFIEVTVTDRDLTNTDPIDIPDGNTDVSDHHQDADDNGFGFDAYTSGGEGGTGITDDKPDDDDKIFEGRLTEEAEFPGGKSARMAFLGKNIIYPEDAASEGIGGDCYVKFVVSKEGDIKSVEVIRGIVDCPACEKEAIRVVKSMPKWKPGKVDGRPVNSYFKMKIAFTPVE